MKFINKVLKMMIFVILMIGIAGVVLPKEKGFKLSALGNMRIEEIGNKFKRMAIMQHPLDGDVVTETLGIPYNIAHLPISNKRPGGKRKIKYIVVHNTANASSTAQNERDYLSNPNNIASTSWHIVVDDHEMIEAIPVTEVAFHAGNGVGNQYGIGIEICESGDMAQAERNAVKLIAYLMKTYNIPIENVKTHQDFSGKECPRQILGHWDNFKEEVEIAYEAL